MRTSVLVLAATATAAVLLVVLVGLPLLRRRAAAQRRARRAWSISTAAAGSGLPESQPEPGPAPMPTSPIAPADPLPARRRADQLVPLDVVVHDGRTQTVASIRHRLGGVDLTFTDGRTAALRAFDTLPGPPPHPSDAS